MALFSSQDEQPQRNQYLTANPNTNTNANTSWMSPSDSTGNNSNVNPIAQTQPNPPSQVSNGTALGSIAQGQGLWNPEAKYGPLRIEPIPGSGLPQTQPQAQNNNVGHDGVFNGMNREQWRDKWMSSGKMSPEEMTKKLTEMGATNAGRGDYWTTPHGETYDLGIGYKTGNPMAGWTPVNQAQQQAGMIGTSQNNGGMFGGGGMMQQIMQMLQGNQNNMQQQNVPQQSNYFQSMQQQPTRNNSLIESYLGNGSVSNKYGGINPFGGLE